MQDKIIIEQFIKFLRENYYPELYIDKYPDQDNRNSPDIDAIAGKFAIEHTSIDTTTNQRRNADYFSKIIDQLEQEFSTKLHFRLRIIIPYEEIKQGLPFSEIKEALRSWLTDAAPTLPDGQHKISGQLNIPFDFVVHKESHRPACVLFSRSKPDTKSLPKNLSKQLKGKLKKLSQYKKIGKEIILLVESNDIALMNQFVMIQHLSKALEKNDLDLLDQIWYADTSVSEFPQNIHFRDLTEFLKVSDHT